jgi:hypothetical protein
MCAMFLALRYRVDLTGLTVLPGLFGYIAVSRWLAGGGWVATVGIPAISVIGVGVALYVLVMAKVLNISEPVTVRCKLQQFAPFLDVATDQTRPLGCRGP